jgi:hypothetical protein
MLNPADRLVVSSGEVAAEIIDGEAIIMNLSSGMYYSMDRVGAVLWEWLARGHTMEEIVEGLSARFAVAPSVARADVETLFGQLIQEGLVQVAASGGEHLGRPAPAEGLLPYQPPQLNRYGDMAELLALDPPMPTPALSPWGRPDERA